MKKILIATDFSAGAGHAAEYAYKLAARLKADLILCNAFLVPAEIPEAGLITWPVYEYEELDKESTGELKLLKEALEQNDKSQGFKPTITCISDTGTITNVVNELIKKEDIELMVVGTHNHSDLSTLILGNHSRKMIDETKRPLLLVPPSIPLLPIKKIAFATDFVQPQKDLQAIYDLIKIARPLNAELLITHISFEKWPDPETRETLESFLTELSNKANYPKIYYRVVKSDQPIKGLNWLCGHGQVDMLVMVHRKHNLLSKLLAGSHTQKMAEHIDIPLLVIPENI